METRSRARVLTIGHSTNSLGSFVALLKRHRITALVDVRSVPYSRHNPQFNQEDLSQYLQTKAIHYLHLGRELGARSSDPSCYNNGRVVYARLAETQAFRQGIDRIIKGSATYHIVVMCAEGEPLSCHRSILVAPRLVERSIDVLHILPNGQLEPNSTTMDRLLQRFSLPHRDLFRSRDELIRQALAQQEERIAYVDDNLASTASNRKS